VIAFHARAPEPLPIIIVGCLYIYTFFFGQSFFPFLGYLPADRTGLVTPVYRAILLAVLTGLPILLCFPLHLRSFAWKAVVYSFCSTTVLYFGLIVAARPELIQTNDRSEALSILIRSTLRGEFPYSQVTHLGGPITPLTAPALLALPTELALHRPDLTTLPLYGLLFLLLAAYSNQTRNLPLTLLTMLTFLNPFLLWELILGSDLSWGPILFGAGVFLLTRRHWILASTLLALCWSSRISFALYLVPLVLFCHRTRGRTELLCVGSSVLLAAVLIAPFALWEPSTYFNFAPLGISSTKLNLSLPLGDNPLWDILSKSPLGSEGVWAGRLRAALLLVVAIATGWTTRTESQLFLACAAVSALLLGLLGPFFLLDYVCWTIVFLALALAAFEPEEDQPATPASSSPA
jgi:hypothetical protein